MNVAIYLRTSTTEQDPNKQKSQCVQFANDKGYNIIGIFHEQISGYKQLERPKYNEVKELARLGKIKAVIVWALDRWVRNRDTLIEDVTILRNYGCNIHSVNDAWLESINIEGPLGKTIQEFLLGILGSLAELESKRKSERAVMAFKVVGHKKWGRKNLPQKVKDQIIELHEQGKSYRDICKEVHYWDSSRNKHNVSMGFVHKTLLKIPTKSKEKIRNKEVQK